MKKYSIENGNRVKRNFNISSHYRINPKKVNPNKFHNSEK